MAGARVGTARSLRSAIRDPERIPRRAARNSPPGAGSSRDPRRPRRRAPERMRGPARPRGCRRDARTRRRRSTGWRRRRGPSGRRIARSSASRVVKPGARVGLWSSARQRIAGLRPRREHVADVGAGVAERADLPVEHRVHVAVRSTMQLPRRKSPWTTVLSVCGGMRAARSVVHAVDGRNVARLGGFELRVPPLELAGDELVAPREVAEPDRVDVDRVQRHQRVDQRFAAVGACGGVELGRRQWCRRAARCRRRTTSRRTGAPMHVGVGAVRERFGHRYRRSDRARR